jgi:nitrate/nitrite-specific signal transduction histidine kinase
MWAFVPMAIILNADTLFAFYTYRQVTEDLVVERNQELTRLLAGQLSTRLIDYAELLSDLPSMAEAQAASPATWQGVLDVNAAQLHAFDGGTAVLDDAGNVIAARGKLSSVVGENASSYRVLHQPEGSEGPFHFTDAIEQSPEGEGVVGLFVPLSGNDERTAGRIVGLFRIAVADEAPNSLFQTALSRKLQDWRGGDVYLVDRAGRAIYHSDPWRIGESMLTQDGVQQVLGGATGAFRTRDLAGEPIVIGIAPVPGTAWGLVTEESWATLIETSQGYRRLLFVFLAAGLIVPVFLIVLGMRQITRPIVELTSAAHEMAEGDFEQRIVARTGDELEDLAEQFNRMTAQLKELYASLEQRVADRTRELSALYQIATVGRASLDLEEILGRSLEQVLTVMESEMGAVHLFDEQSQILRMAVWRGLPAEAISQATVVPLGQGLVSWVYEQGEPVIVPQIATSERRLRAFPAAGDQAYAGAPLRTKGQTLGVLSIVTLAGQSLTSEERALLAAIADQVAVTIENTRLRAEAQQVAVLRERERLARDLHDSVTQSLYSLTLWIEAGQRSLRTRDLERIEEYLARLGEGTRQAIRDMRLLVYELRPPVLEREGLVGALRERLDAVEKRSGIEAQLLIEGQVECSIGMERELYHIAQEALNNVLKHAESSEVTVRLHADDGCVELEIADDGCGFDRDAVADKGGMGLVNMRQRAEELGGSLSILSSPGKGTRIHVSIPRPTDVTARAGEEK